MEVIPMPTMEQARAWTSEQDPVHGWDHVERVVHMAERLAREVGADAEIVRAAALLHDAAGAHPGSGEARRDHEHDSADVARRVLTEEGWPEDRIGAVEHCIRAHRFRGQERPGTLEAQVLFDADKLDVMGAFGAARTIGYALQAGAPIYAPPSQAFIDRGQAEHGELHSAYHEYLFKLRKVKDRLYTEPARRIGEQRHRVLCAFFDQLAAEAEGVG
jgi:uncharacterized protein